jgi:NitT/TauT family transport system ATP-binding protein
MNGAAHPQAGSTPRLDARSITLTYRQCVTSERTVLVALDLVVQPGELVSILGPSGSGKSSLLRILAGLLTPTAGDVQVEGIPLRSPRADVALAFQDPRLLPWLSVERNVAFGLGFRHQQRLSRLERRERVDAALTEVGLANGRHLMPSQLSGGMAQRVALARCLSRRPRVLLLDEPFGALDEVTRADMQQLLLKVVRDTGAATVLVTHDIDEALQISDRVVLLGTNGKLAGEWSIDLPHPRENALDAMAELRVSILRTLQTSVRSGQPAIRGDALRDRLVQESAASSRSLP